MVLRGSTAHAPVPARAADAADRVDPGGRRGRHRAHVLVRGRRQGLRLRRPRRRAVLGHGAADHGLLADGEPGDDARPGARHPARGVVDLGRGDGGRLVRRVLPRAPPGGTRRSRSSSRPAARRRRSPGRASRGTAGGSPRPARTWSRGDLGDDAAAVLEQPAAAVLLERGLLLVARPVAVASCSGEGKKIAERYWEPMSRPWRFRVRRVVGGPEALEQLLVGDLLRVERDLDRLGVAGAVPRRPGGRSGARCGRRCSRRGWRSRRRRGGTRPPRPRSSRRRRSRSRSR